jgi:lipopolysaccharide transport system ATP-binding protein
MSSNDIAIRVEDVSMRFELYDAPRDQLKQFVLPRLQRMTGRKPKQYCREFWALKDISFEVKNGESLGIVGRNGSGKSTLLQIITGTLSATTGAVATQGRVAALLELGSGFNPEFTGRENAHLNGALLGLSRDEMDELIPEIAKFAGIGDFFDRPVKQYSSGMLVRVAFAVQAQVNPDILIVDEALAVGDAVFQHKCARRIHELRERGTTLLFVSHDPSAIAAFCDRALLIHQGEQIALGSAKEIIELYLARVKQDLYVSGDLGSVPETQVASFLDYVPCVLGSNPEGIDISHVGARIGTGDGRITHVNIFDHDGRVPIAKICSGESFRFRVRLETRQPIHHPVLCYRIDTLRGIQITGSTSAHDKCQFPSMIAGQHVDIDIENILPLKQDTYSLSLYFNDFPPGLPPVVVDGLETVAHIEITAPKGISPIYMVDTDHRWFTNTENRDPARRVVRRLEGEISGAWHIQVLDTDFTAPDHWFWPQYADGWEIETFCTFRRFLHDNAKFVDIGAWIGPTVMFASALGVKIIHAVEANSESATLLGELVKHSPALIGAVTIHNLCINDRESLVTFGNLDGSHATSSASSLRGLGFEVSGIKLYDFLVRNGLVDADLIKIDIEGAEELIGIDLKLLASAGPKAMLLSMHPPLWNDAHWPQELLDSIALFQVYDSHGRPLSLDELDRRCRDKTERPEWGTTFGNFFEVLLMPRDGC